MFVPQAPLQLPKRNRTASENGEPEVAARTRLTNARFHRLLDYCASVLGESVRATEELSQRVSSLRKVLEQQGSGENRRNNGESGS